jgi:hypothetical protein
MHTLRILHNAAVINEWPVPIDVDVDNLARAIEIQTRQLRSRGRCAVLVESPDGVIHIIACWP